MKKIIAIAIMLFIGLSIASCTKEDPKKEYTFECSENLTVEVGQNINPRDYFMLKDGDKIIDNEDVNIAIISGSVNTVGEIKYQIHYDGQTYELILQVIEKKKPLPDDPIVEEEPLLAALEKALKKNYDNVTLSIQQKFTSDLEDDFEIHEVNYLDYDTYHIEYEETGSNSFEFFVDKQADYVYLYSKTLNEWRNTPLTYAQWESLDYNGNYLYSDYYSKYVTPASFSLQTNEFKVENEKIVCIPTRLDLVGQKIFNISDDNAAFTSIEIVLENEYLKEIKATYNSSDDYGDFTNEIKYTYTNIGTTTIVLPDALPDFAEEPEHIDPNLATSLSAIEKQTLTKALANDYAKYTFDYYYNEDNGKTIIQESDVVSGYSYHIKQNMSGNQNGSYDYYFEIQDVNANRRYYIYEVDENKKVVRTQLTTQQEIINYMPIAVSPAKLKLSVNSFGKVGDVYVCTPAGLKTEVKNFSTMSGAALISLVLTLNEEECISKIEIITKVDAASGTYYIEESYTYSSIGEASLVIPTNNSSVLQTMTDSQREELSQAFQKEYSNATIYDEYTGSTFYFDGENIKTVVPDGYESITDYYKIENGKYYEYKDGAYVEIPFHSSNKEEVSFEYYLPVPNFNAIDFSKVSYDSFHNTYYISIKDLDLPNFLYYYDIDLGITFTGIEFVLDEKGYVYKINLEAVSQDGTYYIGMGLAFLEIGKTTV